MHSPTLPLRPSVVAIALAVLMLAASVVAGPAAAVTDVTPARVEGPDRIATAAAVADLAHPTGTTQAVIATAGAAQDALVATSLAGALDAAMLLVYPDTLPTATSDALEDLGVTDITIVGDETAVSATVADQLTADGRTVSRLAGEDQYATAVLTARGTVDRSGLPVVDGRATMLLANGEGFADALAGSAAAYAGPTPVLLTPADALSPEAAAYIDEVDVEQVVILGGSAAVSAAVANEVTALGPQVVRLGGETRVETSTTVASWTAEEFNMGLDDVLLARGDDFPDSLTAGQLGGTVRAPLIVAAGPNTLSTSAQRWLVDRCGSIEVVQAIGGTAALSASVLQQAERAAESCAAGEQPGPGVGDDALPNFVVTPLPELNTGVARLDTIEVSDLDGISRLDVAMFACGLVTVDTDGSAIFLDANNDGEADGFATTEEGSAVITGINFLDVDDDQVVRNNVPDDGVLGIQVSSGITDCAVVVTFPATTGGLDVDANGRPTVAYGATIARFDSGEPSPEPTEPTEPPTEEPTEPPSEERNPTEVFAIAPAAPVNVSAGQSVELTVSRFDGEAIGRTLSLIMFPCNLTDVEGDGIDTFTDADNDNAADGFETTETGQLLFTAENGQSVEPQRGVGPVAVVNGQIKVTVTAGSGTDCATVAAIAGNGNGRFDLNADDEPIEPYGITQVRLG